MNSISILILTFNEKIHLERCIRNCKNFADDVVVIDSFSTDETESIALENGVRFYQNKFVNHSAQINWALKNVPFLTDWILRLDADELLSEDLKKGMIRHLESASENVKAFQMKRLIHFMGAPIKYGGSYPIWHLRLWRSGSAISESKWMDERMVLVDKGEVGTISQGDIHDINLNDLGWWVKKHNSYALKEAFDYLSKYVPRQGNTIDNIEVNSHRRSFKNIYNNLPLFWRVYLLFFYRLFIKGAFRDGIAGLIWVTLQGFWYRFLVDAKIYELRKLSREQEVSIEKVLQSKYGIDITSDNFN